MRPRSRPFGEQERSFLRLLLPHLARGLALHPRLNVARAERDAHAEVVDRLGGGVVFLDRHGHRIDRKVAEVDAALVVAADVFERAVISPATLSPG